VRGERAGEDVTGRAGEGKSHEAFQCPTSPPLSRFSLHRTCSLPHAFAGVCPANASSDEYSDLEEEAAHGADTEVVFVKVGVCGVQASRTACSVGRWVNQWRARLERRRGQTQRWRWLSLRRKHKGSGARGGGCAYVLPEACPLVSCFLLPAHQRQINT